MQSTQSTTIPITVNTHISLHTRKCDIFRPIALTVFKSLTMHIRHQLESHL